MALGQETGEFNVLPGVTAGTRDQQDRSPMTCHFNVKRGAVGLYLGGTINCAHVLHLFSNAVGLPLHWTPGRDLASKTAMDSDDHKFL